MRLVNSQFDIDEAVHFLHEEPDECPICNCKVNPEHHMAHQIIGDEGSLLRIVYSCPNNECKELFIGYFHSDGQFMNGGYDFDYVKPNNIKPIEFDARIEDISSLFIEIYNQARSAEINGLDQICGMGYRKSLEFLIKDFLVYVNPEDEEEIKSDYRLGNIIETRIDSKRLKDIAKRAAWLGNDHSHYTRKWESKDVNDLKTLIDMTLHWIQNELLYNHYMDEM